VNQALGRSCGGFGSKIHLVTDGNGLPLGFCLSQGQSAKIRYATSALAMEKGYPPHQVVIARDQQRHH
jgi:hypothetical protein